MKTLKPVETFTTLCAPSPFGLHAKNIILLVAWSLERAQVLRDAREGTKELRKAKRTAVGCFTDPEKTQKYRDNIEPYRSEQRALELYTLDAYWRCL